MTIFFINFQENPEKRLWRYVALCGAIFQTLENHQKMPNMIRTNTYDHFFDQFSKNPENGCGAMWRYVALFFERLKIVKKCQI